MILILCRLMFDNSVYVIGNTKVNTMHVYSYIENVKTEIIVDEIYINALVEKRVRGIE